MSLIWKYRLKKWCELLSSLPISEPMATPILSSRCSPFSTNRSTSKFSWHSTPVSYPTVLWLARKLPISSRYRCLSRPISILSNFDQPSCTRRNSNPITVSSVLADSSSTTATTTLSCLPGMLNNAEYLENEFGGEGLRFSSIGEMCVVEMRVQNGSSARLLLPSGLITSYRPLMWHGGYVELLHTIVSGDSNEESSASVQGGISLVLNDLNYTSEEDGSYWSAKDWTVQSVSAKPDDAIQVTLRCCNNEGNLSVKYVVTLYDKLLTTAVLVDNISSSPIELTSSVMTNLSLSTPDAAYAIGLRESSYCTKAPLPSEFTIVSNIQDESKPSLSWLFLQHLFDTKEGSQKREFATGDKGTESLWVVEKDDFVHLRNKMSRIYCTSRQQIRINDRGKRLTLILRKLGFEEFYISSPGSNSRRYGKHCYICTGPASMHKPVVLSPGENWRAAQVLENPNI